MGENFEVIFVKLAEALEEVTVSRSDKNAELSREELNEIDELRRLTIETLRPMPLVFTTT